MRLKSIKGIKSNFSHKKHKIQTSFVDAFNKKQKDKRPYFFYMFLKYLKKKSFIHLFVFYAFFVCKFLYKKNKFEIPLITSYT